MHYPSLKPNSASTGVTEPTVTAGEVTGGGDTGRSDPDPRIGRRHFGVERGRGGTRGRPHLGGGGQGADGAHEEDSGRDPEGRRELLVRMHREQTLLFTNTVRWERRLVA